MPKPRKDISIDPPTIVDPGLTEFDDYGHKNPFGSGSKASNHITLSPKEKKRLNNTAIMPKAARILKQAQSDNFNSAA